MTELVDRAGGLAGGAQPRVPGARQRGPDEIRIAPAAAGDRLREAADACLRLWARVIANQIRREHGLRERPMVPVVYDQPEAGR